jgi:hypothetical protein
MLQEWDQAYENTGFMLTQKADGSIMTSPLSDPSNFLDDV